MVMVVPYLIEAVSFYIFVIFAICNFMCMPLVYFFYPETANRYAIACLVFYLYYNRTLEEIDILFSSKSAIVKNAEREWLLNKANYDGP